MGFSCSLRFNPWFRVSYWQATGPGGVRLGRVRGGRARGLRHRRLARFQLRQPRRRLHQAVADPIGRRSRPRGRPARLVDDPGARRRAFRRLTSPENSCPRRARKSERCSSGSRSGAGGSHCLWKTRSRSWPSSPAARGPASYAPSPSGSTGPPRPIWAKARSRRSSNTSRAAASTRSSATTSLLPRSNAIWRKRWTA